MIGSQVLVTLTSQDVSKATLEAIIQENTPFEKDTTLTFRDSQ